MNTLDIVGNSLVENLSNFISVDPNYANDIRIIYPYDEVEVKENFDNKKPTIYGYSTLNKGEQFGYEKKKKDLITKISKGLILFEPERRFLKTVGILFDDKQTGGGALPIIAFFEEQDNVVKRCKIELITTHYKNEKDVIEIKRTLEVIDVKTAGFGGTGKIIYILGPVR